MAISEADRQDASGSVIGQGRKYSWLCLSGAPFLSLGPESVQSLLFSVLWIELSSNRMLCSQFSSKLFPLRRVESRSLEGSPERLSTWTPVSGLLLLGQAPLFSFISQVLCAHTSTTARRL